MNCYIKEIVIFDSNGAKRSVPFTPGLNIITGQSKTGKSALIEIVDYCLCSKVSTIPQGEIMTFGYLFAIVLAFPNKQLIIGRKKYSEGGNTQMYVKAEAIEFESDNLSLKYFQGLTSSKIKNGAQTEIERHFGLSVVDMDSSYEVAKKRGKASLRNMTPYLFQHQNLMANKHALFYRFDDFNKRKSTIEEFPVFAGWVGDGYFSILRQIEEKEKEVRLIKISQKKRLEDQKAVESTIRELYRNYYSIIGKVFPENLDFNKLLELKNNLPDFDNQSYVSQEVQNRYSKLIAERNNLNIEFNGISRKIKDLESSQLYSDEYEVSLEGLSRKSSTIIGDHDTFSCPTCGQENQQLNKELEELMRAQQSLQSELEQVSTYSISYVKEIENLSSKRDTTRRSIKRLNIQIKDLEESIQEIKRQKDLGDRAIYAKAKLDIKLSEIIENQSSLKNGDLEELQGELELLRKKLTSYGLERRFNASAAQLNNTMNEICNSLDFEEELRPSHLVFDLEDFSLIHNDERIGNISLSEMGSGANWLACHISLFMGLLELFAIEEKSTVPSFVFFDQPSQVYFPHKFEGEGKDKDIKEVENIYNQIINAISRIEEKSNFKPQVIVTDHADNLELNGKDFEGFVRRRWTDNNGLI